MTDWQPFQTGAPPLERAVQARYWTLAKHARQAVCEGVAHPLGTEVTVSVNGELIRGEVARTADQARTLASQWCAAFIDKEWNPSGPERAPTGAVRWMLHRRGLDVLCESVSRADGGFDLVLSLRGLTIEREICRSCRAPRSRSPSGGRCTRRTDSAPSDKESGSSPIRRASARAVACGRLGAPERFANGHTGHQRSGREAPDRIRPANVAALTVRPRRGTAGAVEPLLYYYLRLRKTEGDARGDGRGRGAAHAYQLDDRQGLARGSGCASSIVIGYRRTYSDPERGTVRRSTSRPW